MYRPGAKNRWCVHGEDRRMDEGAAAAGELDAPRWENLSIFMLITTTKKLSLGWNGVGWCWGFVGRFKGFLLDIAQWENLSILMFITEKAACLRWNVAAGCFNVVCSLFGAVGRRWQRQRLTAEADLRITAVFQVSHLKQKDRSTSKCLFVCSNSCEHFTFSVWAAQKRRKEEHQTSKWTCT